MRPGCGSDADRIPSRPVEGMSGARLQRLGRSATAQLKLPTIAAGAAVPRHRQVTCPGWSASAAQTPLTSTGLGGEGTPSTKQAASRSESGLDETWYRIPDACRIVPCVPTWFRKRRHGTHGTARVRVQIKGSGVRPRPVGATVEVVQQAPLPTTHPHKGSGSDSRGGQAGSSRRTVPTRSMFRSKEAMTPTPARSALAIR